MSDLFDRVTSQQDVFKKLLTKIPGFAGYVERLNRRSSDKLLRETIANRFEEQWQHLSSVQRDMIGQGDLAHVDDMEAASLKLRQFIDRVRLASYGYSGFFDAIKVNQDELTQLYQYDLTLVELVDQVSNAIDNVEASLGTDGLPAAIRNLTSMTGQCVETFDKRSEVVLAGSVPTSPSQ
jgi:hypothetical protein